MNLLEEHLDYILETATARAVEIARLTGRMQQADIDDFKQDVILFLCRRAATYNPERAKPTTFIAMVMNFAKKQILRKMHRLKRRIDVTAITDIDIARIADARNRTDRQQRILEEYITKLNEPERSIVWRVVMQAEKTSAVAKTVGTSRRNILHIVRNAMRSYAESIGIDTSKVAMAPVTKRYSLSPNVTDTPREVPSSGDTLSFAPNTAKKGGIKTNNKSQHRSKK